MEPTLNENKSEKSSVNKTGHDEVIDHLFIENPTRGAILSGESYVTKSIGRDVSDHKILMGDFKLEKKRNDKNSYQ